MHKISKQHAEVLEWCFKRNVPVKEAAKITGLGEGNIGYQYQTLADAGKTISSERMQRFALIGLNNLTPQQVRSK